MDHAPIGPPDEADTETALVVLVGDLDPVVGPWKQRLDPSAAWGMLAHVPLLVADLPLSTGSG